MKILSKILMIVGAGFTFGGLFFIFVDGLDASGIEVFLMVGAGIAFFYIGLTMNIKKMESEMERDEKETLESKDDLLEKF